MKPTISVRHYIYQLFLRFKQHSLSCDKWEKGHQNFSCIIAPVTGQHVSGKNHEQPRRYHKYVLLIISAIVFLVGGCAEYQAEPLPGNIDLIHNINLAVPYGTQHRDKHEIGLTLAEISILAVRNNPVLKAKRRQLGVAQAQLYCTGLFPDPQLSANLDHPVVNTIGTVNAIGIDLGYDILALITRKPRIDSKKQILKRTKLQILWQEWQVSEKARSLAVRLADQRRRIYLLHRMKILYLNRYKASRKALIRGDVTLDITGTDLTAFLDVSSQINQLEQTYNNTTHALNLLLGLTPETRFKVCLSLKPVLLDYKELHKKMKSLSERRPDLLALQAGYKSQEAVVRTAILSQFPSISIGITHSRDTGSIYTNGFNIGLNLPFFSGNRGTIAIERATREQLRAEYQARLDQTAMDVDKLICLQKIITKQQLQLEKYLPELKILVTSARSAYQRGDIDALTFLNMETAWIKKCQEKVNLDQVLREDIIALQTLLAIPESAITSGNGAKVPNKS